MSGLSAVGLVTSFGAGIVSFLSPCVLPLVPGYISYVAGGMLITSGELAGRLTAFRLSMCFVLGFSTVFVILGASATSLGQLLLAYRYEANLVGGAVVLVLGLFMMGLARLSWLQREFRLHHNLGGGRPVAAYVIGVAFAFGWSPCIGPVLGAILTTSAVFGNRDPGRRVVEPLFAGARAPVPRRSPVHRQPDIAAEGAPPARPIVATRRRRGRHRDGGRDVDRRIDDSFVLASRHLSDPRKARVMRAMERSASKEDEDY
jgi:cytochrome c-type biogenesis protein